MTTGERELTTRECQMCGATFRFMGGGRGKETRAQFLRRKYCSHACAQRSHVRPSMAEWFEQSIYREPMSGCWLWTKSVDTHGYGQAAIATKVITKAHRASWTLHRGPVPDGLHVLHRCDVPSCCNPAHLFLGTHTDNMRDMVSKGRDAATRRAL